jgi:regulatory protein
MVGKKWDGNRSADADFETMSDFETLSAGDLTNSTPRGTQPEDDQSLDSLQLSGQQVKKAGPSLKARAVAILSRREHSRHELKQKLAAHANESDDLDALLDELARENWQSDERFAQSLVNRRADRKGAQLILKELRQHGLESHALEQLTSELMDTELERARAVWQRKFGSLPADARAYAKQYRFLASRGFSSDCVRRILGDKD